MICLVLKAKKISFFTLYIIFINFAISTLLLLTIVIFGFVLATRFVINIEISRIAILFVF